MKNNILHATHPVFGGKNFHAEEGRSGKDFLFRAAQDDAEIRDAEPIGARLHALFRVNLNAPVLSSREKVRSQRDLHIAMISFAQIALQYLAVDIVAIGTVDGR